MLQIRTQFGAPLRIFNPNLPFNLILTPFHRDTTHLKEETVVAIAVHPQSSNLEIATVKSTQMCDAPILRANSVRSIVDTTLQLQTLRVMFAVSKQNSSQVISLCYVGLWI